MNLQAKFLIAAMRVGYLHASCGGAAVHEEGAIGPLHLCKPERQGKTTTFRQRAAQFKQRQWGKQFYLEAAQIQQSLYA